MKLKRSRIRRAVNGGTVLPLSSSIHRINSHWVDDHMNTKMIFAAMILSLGLAGCAKEEAPADVTTEPAPAADSMPSEAPPADAAPMEGAPTDDGMATTDETTPPADGATTEPTPAQ